MRSVGHRVREDAQDNDCSDRGMLSQSSDSIKAINWVPFEMQFEFTEEELDGLKDAFEQYMDSNKTISFNELFHDLKAIDIQHKQPLLFEILERILSFDEIGEGKGNDRIDFETFLKLIRKSLNLRNTRQHVETLFHLFDEEKTGFIQQANLAKVVDDLNMREQLGQEDIRKILLCCSSRGDRISFNEFHLIMTRQDKNDFSGTPAYAQAAQFQKTKTASKAGSSVYKGGDRQS